MTELLNVKIAHAGYETDKSIITDIAFSIHAGELVGLIGPNGAGKSTTIKAIIGLLKHMQGEVTFPESRASYAYIPEKPMMYDELTLWEHLELAAAAYEIPPDHFVQKAEALLKQYNLHHVKHDFPIHFSKGMQQKLMLILSFLIDTDVYIVDEPFIGLDPHATKDFLAMLEQEQQRGAGVLMSTHVLDTAERICDSFVLVNEGKLVMTGDLQDLRTACDLPEGTLFDCFHALSQPKDVGA